MLYYGSKLSENIKRREPEGYLYCLNVPIARTGKQPYLRRELGLEGEGIVQVIRTPEEVFSKATIASFEGMPVCDDHPFADVDSGNITAYGKGHVQNVRRGQPPDDDLLFADIIITHEDLIDAVLSGKREISCGYKCDYYQAEDGNVYQRAIRGNHVAVVDNGRAGNRVAIRDAAPEINERRITPMPNSKKPSLLARAVAKFVRDSEPDEGAQAIDEMLETGADDQFPGMAAPETPKQDAAPAVPAAPAKAAAVPAAPVPAAPAPAAPAAVPAQKDETPADPMQQILALLNELKAALVKPKPEPLDELEKELATVPGDSEPPTVPAEKMHDEEPEEVQDEDLEEETQDEDPEEQPTEDCGTSSAVAQDTRAALLSVLKGVRQTVATLPAAERKKVSDSMNAAIRKAAGLTPESKATSAKKLAAIASGKKATRDSAIKEETDDGEYGRQLMAKYNPHYKK